MKRLKLLPPFSVYVEGSAIEKKVIGEDLNYPDAIQLRFSWKHEMIEEGYQLGFNTNRLRKGSLWQDCHILDSKGVELK